MSSKPEVCRNCERAQRIEYEDGYICSGIVKDPTPEFDIIRWCLLHDTSLYSVDLAPDEAMSTTSAISRSAVEAMLRNHKYKVFRHITKETKVKE